LFATVFATCHQTFIEVLIISNGIVVFFTSLSSVCVLNKSGVVDFLRLVVHNKLGQLIVDCDTGVIVGVVVCVVVVLGCALLRLRTVGFLTSTGVTVLQDLTASLDEDTCIFCLLTDSPIFDCISDIWLVTSFVTFFIDVAIYVYLIG
jgi:hypothetical protein